MILTALLLAAAVAFTVEVFGDAHPSTITPPARPGLTAEQIEKLADTLEELVAFLRRRL